MTEPVLADRPAGAASAGALLRAAREKQGMHVAALAASLKIPPRKLEALEADRLDELPDAAFARALAMTICRVLKIDAAAVLVLLPSAGVKTLADARGGLNMPLRERAGRADRSDSSVLRHPLVWAALLVLGAAAVLYFGPAGWWSAWLPGGRGGAPEANAAAAVPQTVAIAPAASAPAQIAAERGTLPAAADMAASTTVIEVVHAAPAPDGSASAAELAAGVALLRVSEASWVEVVDANGLALVQRVLQPGESLGLDGKLPLRLKIGNAAATQLSFRGQRVDLSSVTRDNVARLELK